MLEIKKNLLKKVGWGGVGVGVGGGGADPLDPPESAPEYVKALKLPYYSLEAVYDAN
jgi:hypothetical protein